MTIPFNASERSTVGVEWELQLVSRETRELVSAASEVLQELCPEGEHPKAKHELYESTVEIITGICSTVAEATDDLAGTVAELRPLLDARGLGLACSGTHPITDWAAMRISPNERYQGLVDTMQQLARQLQIFGVHVHVGVRGQEKAIPIVNAVSAYIPHFLALTSSSPYWLGQDTGLASSRSKVFENLPTAGLPYQLADWAEFESYMATLLRTGAIGSIKEVWWDIRPHPEFGTVELRISDGLPTLYEVGMVAALSQCLVDTLDREIDKGYTLPTPKGWIVRENKWRAARWGLDARIIREDESTIPVRDALLELAHDLKASAERLGCSEELARIEQVVAHGSSAQRQRAVGASGDLKAVVDSLLAEFEAGRPL
jgi:carboxylate-amine ligase